MSDIEAQAMKKLAIFLLVGVAIATPPFALNAAEEVAVEESETVLLPTDDAMTAIEVIIGKRIPETVLDDGRPHHVYRPKTPIFHQNHPENEPEPPAIRKHLLVDHPELKNNQGRVIRTPPDVEGETPTN
ncbi:hypothetical protein K6Q96_11625 [Grimontia kaedaensis]|uniref:Uncharacterized protein n=1 Tax=Grimontia kaedaensis TaxID=2872157 RepID=A0ABY4WPQ4_9GAMM|nr:hypothetical protein [Grimontia kaedaensis]USH01541.1 hypothetical protein K6Q96_11625 [Grimontia kaedaensis]